MMLKYMNRLVLVSCEELINNKPNYDDELKKHRDYIRDKSISIYKIESYMIKHNISGNEIKKEYLKRVFDDAKIDISIDISKILYNTKIDDLDDREFDFSILINACGNHYYEINEMLKKQSVENTIKLLIGLHLKNPKRKNIHEYYYKYAIEKKPWFEFYAIYKEIYSNCFNSEDDVLLDHLIDINKNILKNDKNLLNTCMNNYDLILDSWIESNAKTNMLKNIPTSIIQNAINRYYYTYYFYKHRIDMLNDEIKRRRIYGL